MPGRALEIAGTIEGFYGPPWSHDRRLAHLRFCAATGFTIFVYAPKDDPYHRRRWREPYPAADLARIAELAGTADALGLRFVCALHPALDMRYSDDAEHAALAAKATQLHGAGVREFALLFDDVPYELAPADAAAFGAGAAGLGAAHGVTARWFRDGFLAAHGIAGPLLVCPTDYAGVEPSAYRDAFAAAAPAEVVLTWTGRGVVVGSVTRAEVDAAAASYRRPLLLWDNFPVNDYEPSRLFLGPLTGRTGEVAGSALVGVVANAMSEEPASRIPLTTVAEWARRPAAYEPDRAYADALDATGATALEPFVRVCRSWPPSADQDPELSAATAAALTGESSALDTIESRLAELAACCTDPDAPADLVDSLRPWLAGAAATAAAGLAAVGVLRGRTTVAEARAALAEAESHYANVLRPIVPSFVRSVLDQAAPAAPAAGLPVVAVLGDAGDPAVRATCEFLAARGVDPRVNARVATAATVVVTASAPVAELEALAAAPVPVIAWGGLVELGLASSVSAEMLWHGVQVVPGDPLAAGLAGAVPLYRGPGYVGVAAVGPDAGVVARGPDGGSGAVAFRYAPGDRLVTGRPAPAVRIGLFPTRHGPAPWLLDPSGAALLAAAVEVAGRA